MTNNCVNLAFVLISGQNWSWISSLVIDHSPSTSTRFAVTNSWAACGSSWPAILLPLLPEWEPTQSITAVSLGKLRSELCLTITKTTLTRRGDRVLIRLILESALIASNCKLWDQTRINLTEALILQPSLVPRAANSTRSLDSSHALEKRTLLQMNTSLLVECQQQ